MQPQAIIFDLDGTLTDTETIWDDVRRGMAEEAGVPWPEAATRAMMGMSTKEWGSYLAETVGLPLSAPEAARAVIDGVAARYERDLPVLPGAVAAVRRMAERYTLAVASSSPRRLIDVSVATLGLADVFAVTVSTEEVDRGKPAPDGFLRAAELLGVEPTACVAIEDSTNGILSALAAGMTVIAVPPHFHPPTVEVLAQTRVLESLDELTTEFIDSL